MKAWLYTDGNTAEGEVEMDGRTAIKQLLDAERMFLETVRHDTKNADKKTLCERRIGIYQKLLLARSIADFKDDNHVDELKYDVDQIAREVNGALRRYERAVDGLVSSLEPSALAAE